MLVKLVFIVIFFCNLIFYTYGSVVIDKNISIDSKKLGLKFSTENGYGHKYKSLSVLIDEDVLPKCMSIREFGIYNRNDMKVLGRYVWEGNKIPKENLKISMDVLESEIEFIKVVIFYKYVHLNQLSEREKSWCSKNSNVEIYRSINDLLKYEP